MKMWDYLNGSDDSYMGTLSPDGKNLAYISNESGVYQVYVQSFPDKTGKWQISPGPGIEPKWSPDGKKLFYSSQGKMMVVDVLGSDPFRFGKPRMQYEGDRRISIDSGISYDVMRDGKSFVSLSSTNMLMQEGICVIVNWPQELRTRIQPE
jgi:Tol biopolymer transport system component